MLVLGIDPGYDRVGFALVAENESVGNVIYSDCFTPPKESLEKRINCAVCETDRLIKKYKPNVVAIESLFFSKNKKTAMNIAEVRGAIKQKAVENGLEVVEFTPNEIKKVITGDGGADKAQVQKMICMLTEVGSGKMDDEYDAVAIGITYLLRGKL